ncbi:MAG: sigma-E factor negative regulatory protein [Burkholderiales bacterium]|jgi:sigma-E factor negative regulatory protein RseA|nr:sigma-E factor negative regulatory protein [Burkholderiales bacterium]
MVTNRLTDEAVIREKISQWMDGEADEDIDRLVDALLTSDAGRDTWALYHHMGDVLRDGETGGALSAGFTARVMRALEAELAAPASQATATSRQETFPEKKKKFASG